MLLLKTGRTKEVTDTVVSYTIRTTDRDNNRRTALGTDTHLVTLNVYPTFFTWPLTILLQARIDA